MNSEVLHMKIGPLLGEHLLEIAQTNISNGNIEKGLDTYIKSLHGFTKEYALMCLKNEAVLVTDEDEVSVDLTDKKEIREANAHNILDWNHIINNRIKTLNNIKNELAECKEEFENVYSGDIENYNINEMMKRYFNEEQLHNIGCHNIAAHIIGAHDGKILDRGNDNPMNKWHRIEDLVEFDSPDATNYHKILFWTVEYVKLIKMLHDEYVKFDKLYNFLVDNGFINRITFIEQKIENILDILIKFTDIDKGYNNTLCDEGLFNYKKELYFDIFNTKYGNEFCKNGILLKNIMDGYDAGWLSPDGEFYGGLGETSAMIHMNIAEQIFKTPCNVYSVRMMKDGVDILSGIDSPEYWLEKHGWVKIHHEDCYGAFIGHRGEEPTPDFPYAYNPTDIQIKMICDYADKFYGSKFYTEANALGRITHTEPFTTYAVRQMDEFKIHEIFGR